MLDSLIRYDAALRAWLATHHASLLDSVMLVLSAVGRRGAVWLGLGLVLAALRPARLAGMWQLALAVGLAGLVTDFVIKPWVGRVRPFTAVMDVRVIGERPKTFSFPSGHAATAGAGAYALSRIWPAARAALWTLAALIAFSRVYVGVHYPLDVLAGLAIGVACGLFVVGGSRWKTDRAGYS